MAYEIRALTVDDLPASWELTRIAFGAGREAPAGWLGDRPGRVTWGAFDESGRLVAKAMDRDQAHWFGGRLVPACGVAGVVTVPELRRAGLGRAVLTRTLHAARERGAAIATLFRTSPVPYRRLDFEEVGALTWMTVPASALRGVTMPAGVGLRPAGSDDLAAVEEIYRTVARTSAGMLERSGPLSAASDPLREFDGVTLAVRDGRVEGYATWDRKSGYQATGRVNVFDLVGPAAVAARGWPPHLSGSVDLELGDAVCPWNTGSWRLVLERGEGRLEPGGSGAVRVTMRGLAVLYAGGPTPAVLRRAGLLAGDEGSDAFLAAASAGPVPALLDYF